MSNKTNKNLNMLFAIKNLQEDIDKHMKKFHDLAQKDISLNSIEFINNAILSLALLKDIVNVEGYRTIKLLTKKRVHKMTHKIALVDKHNNKSEYLVNEEGNEYEFDTISEAYAQLTCLGKPTENSYFVVVEQYNH